jgi:tetratricopeptide (TPR) repeat protein
MAATAAPLPAPRPDSQAAYPFTLGKLLASEGEVQEALAAFDEASRLAPDDPYVHVERAHLLARLAQVVRQPQSRMEHLRQAADEVRRARALGPDNPDVLRAVGEIHLELAQFEPTALAVSEEVFERLRQLDPSDVPVMVTLGRIYLERGQPERATGVFRDLVLNAPGNRIASSLLVEALLKSDKPAEAEAVLAEMLATDPTSLESRLTLAEVQSERGDHRASLATLLAAPEEVRADPRLRRQLASALYLTGDLESALQTADSLLASQPGNQYLSLLKGLILTAEGRNREALELLGKLREADPRDLTLAATVARLMRREGRADEAAALLAGVATDLTAAGKPREAQQARLELAQGHADAKAWDRVLEVTAPMLASTDEAVRTQALLLRSDALLSLARYDEALELLEREGRDSPVLAGRQAEALFRAGRERPARRELERLARAPEPQSVLAAAQAYHRLGRYDESIPLLKGLLARHPDLPPAGFLLGAAYERTGKRGEAIEAFRGVLKADPDFHAALNYLGYMYAETGENLEEALRLVRRAVALDPDNGAYVDSLGWTHFRLRQYDRARDYLERASRLDPADPTVHEHLGDLYVALGQTEKARQSYQRALELGDDNAEQVQRKLEGLRDGTPRR